MVYSYHFAENPLVCHELIFPFHVVPLIEQEIIFLIFKEAGQEG
jgi:hypothetical protein